MAGKLHAPPPPPPPGLLATMPPRKASSVGARVRIRAAVVVLRTLAIWAMVMMVQPGSANDAGEPGVPLIETGDPRQWANVTFVPAFAFYHYYGDVTLADLVHLEDIRKFAFNNFKGTLTVTGARVLSSRQFTEQGGVHSGAPST